MKQRAKVSSDEGLNEPLNPTKHDDTLSEPLNPYKHYDGGAGGYSSAQVRTTGLDGLTSAEAARLMEEWGPNALPENKKSKVRPPISCPMRPVT